MHAKIHEEICVIFIPMTALFEPKSISTNVVVLIDGRRIDDFICYFATLLSSLITNDRKSFKKTTLLDEKFRTIPVTIATLSSKNGNVSETVVKLNVRKRIVRTW